jgi:hypothetical protein
MIPRFVPSILIVIAVGTLSTATAQERRPDTELARISSFGFLQAHVENTDGTSSNEVGLTDPEMTKYLRARFASHFPKIGFTERRPASVSEDEQGRIGRLWCRVWTVGTSYPIAYFVECRLGSFRNEIILEQSALGYDKRESVQETIRKSLDGALAGLAKPFFQGGRGKPGSEYAPIIRKAPD